MLLCGILYCSRKYPFSSHRGIYGQIPFPLEILVLMAYKTQLLFEVSKTLNQNGVDIDFFWNQTFLIIFRFIFYLFYVEIAHCLGILLTITSQNKVGLKFCEGQSLFFFSVKLENI